jgi:stress response protein SCP2
VICATVANDQATMQNIQSGQIDLVNQQGEVLAIYQLNASDFSQEKAVMLIEIYFKNDLWRIAAIGQGFNGGLKALVRHFGGEVTENIPLLRIQLLNLI